MSNPQKTYTLTSGESTKHDFKIHDYIKAAQAMFSAGLTYGLNAT